MIALLVLALAQTGDLETLVKQLGQDDPAVREKAEKDLVARGPQIVPGILSLQRSTDSAEMRLRAEKILLRFPFPAYVRTRPEEPLQAKLRDAILEGLEDHRPLPGCWRDPQERSSIDAARLLVMSQGGSGHGQTLELDEIAPRKEGELVVRRIAYQGLTPYRPAVREEGTRAEETVLDEGETRALLSLLEAAAALRLSCSIEEEKGTHRWSSASFSLRFRIESGGKVVWRCAYTGYPNSTDKKTYAHGLILDRILRLALAHRTWSAVKFTDDDRRRLLRWTEENFEREEWWVRERYLRMAFTVGDGSYLPFLRKAVKDLEGKEGPSEIRQREAAKEALLKIAGSKD